MSRPHQRRASRAEGTVTRLATRDREIARLRLALQSIANHTTEASTRLVALAALGEFTDAALAEQGETR
jgi:hypothetical protein